MEFNEQETFKSAGVRLSRMMDSLIIVSLTRPVIQKVLTTTDERKLKRNTHIANGGEGDDYELYYASGDKYKRQYFTENTIQSGRLTYFRLLEYTESDKAGYSIDLTLNGDVSFTIHTGEEDQSFTVETINPNTENIF